MSWENALWNELEALTPDQQIIQSGTTISYITSTLLPKLADYRRATIQTEMRKPGTTAGTLADRIGTRASTIKRLASEAHQRSRSEEAA